MKQVNMMMTKDEEYMEFRLINDANMPPVIMSPTEHDRPKIVINIHHKIWLCLHRKTLAGAATAMFEKLDEILTGHLREIRGQELLDLEDEANQNGN
jgi:hypothetical protein